VVAELDRHIVGQNDAKRAVAIAMRNRWRRRQLPDELRREVTPRNVLLVGPTGAFGFCVCVGSSSSSGAGCEPATLYLWFDFFGVEKCTYTSFFLSQAAARRRWPGEWPSSATPPSSKSKVRRTDPDEPRACCAALRFRWLPVDK
jgi:hypothetical protein